MHSSNSIRESVEILLSFRKSSDFLIDINLSPCAILGYRPATSIVYSITSSGKGERLATLDKKSLVFSMYDLTFSASGSK